MSKWRLENSNALEGSRQEAYDPGVYRLSAALRVVTGAMK